jgi:hypothetical protein
MGALRRKLHEANGGPLKDRELPSVSRWVQGNRLND